MGLKGLNPFKRGRPAWVGKISDDSRRIDVRRLIASGEDPLGEVVALAGKIALAETLTIDAPISPVPLRRVLEAQGFESHGEEVASAHWRVWLRRVAASGHGHGQGAAPGGSAGSAAQIVQDETGWTVDGRGVPPPGPMLAVIALIETPAIAGPVFVHLDRDPVHLYSELTERHWKWTRLESEPAEVRLRLDKEST